MVKVCKNCIDNSKKICVHIWQLPKNGDSMKFKRKLTDGLRRIDDRNRILYLVVSHIGHELNRWRVRNTVIPCSYTLMYWFMNSVLSFCKWKNRINFNTFKCIRYGRHNYREFYSILTRVLIFFVERDTSPSRVYLYFSEASTI